MKWIGKYILFLIVSLNIYAEDQESKIICKGNNHSKKTIKGHRLNYRFSEKVLDNNKYFNLSVEGQDLELLTAKINTIIRECASHLKTLNQPLQGIDIKINNKTFPLSISYGVGEIEKIYPVKWKPRSERKNKIDSLVLNFIDDFVSEQYGAKIKDNNSYLEKIASYYFDHINHSAPVSEYKLYNNSEIIKLLVDNTATSGNHQNILSGVTFCAMHKNDDNKDCIYLLKKIVSSEILKDEKLIEAITKNDDRILSKTRIFVVKKIALNVALALINSLGASAKHAGAFVESQVGFNSHGSIKNITTMARNIVNTLQVKNVEEFEHRFDEELNHPDSALNKLLNNIGYKDLDLLIDKYDVQSKDVFAPDP